VAEVAQGSGAKVAGCERSEDSSDARARCFLAKGEVRAVTQEIDQQSGKSGKN
jgi:hypothetical protein